MQEDVEAGAADVREELRRLPGLLRQPLLLRLLLSLQPFLLILLLLLLGLFSRLLCLLLVRLFFRNPLLLLQPDVVLLLINRCYTVKGQRWRVKQLFSVL